MTKSTRHNRAIKTGFVFAPVKNIKNTVGTEMSFERVHYFHSVRMQCYVQNGKKILYVHFNKNMLHRHILG